ncbi:MAG: cation diffusion facilitator family transporter [Microthrixaceae bacterium]|nr:cation diffusion facilitator family transporter [Microthrixaceae bacterium]
MSRLSIVPWRRWRKRGHRHRTIRELEGPVASGGGTKAVVTALLANIGIAVAKFIGFILSGSSSMLAESIHSVADTSNQALLLYGGKRSKKQASEVHQFGYGRVRYISGFIVAIILFSLGGLFAIYEAIHKFQHPEPIESWRWLPIVILLIAMALEGFALRTALHEAESVRGSFTLKEFITRTRAPEIPVIVLEDTGALVGLVFGLFGVGMTLVTHDGRWDAIGSAAIGILLVVIAFVLAREMISMLIGESALPEHHDAIEREIVGGVFDSVIHLRTMHVGPDEILIAAKLAVKPDATATEIAEGINAAEVRIRSALPMTARVYIEPDIRREAGDTMTGTPKR